MDEKTYLRSTISDLFENIEMEDVNDCIEKLSKWLLNSNEDINARKDVLSRYKIEYYNYSKYAYVESCCWLLKILDEMIVEMKKENKKTLMKDINFYFSDDAKIMMGLKTNVNMKTEHKDSILRYYVENEIELPFNFIKKLMLKKGYDIETCGKYVKFDPHDYCEHFERPVKIYYLTITQNETKNNTSSDIKTDTSSDIKNNTSSDIKTDTNSDIKNDTSSDIKNDISSDIKTDKNDDCECLQRKRTKLEETNSTIFYNTGYGC